MGNLHKSYVTFGKRPEALKKLLKTQDNDVPVFLELCRNGKWDARKIIEAATMSFDPLEEGFFEGIASSVSEAFSGARYRRNFRILEHPDLGRVLSTHAKTKDIFTQYQPDGPIELQVLIEWEFRSKKPDERVHQVADDQDLHNKVLFAANFSGLIDVLADEIEKEFNKNGGNGLKQLIEDVLQREAQNSIQNAQAEFYRVLGLTSSKVAWQDTITVVSALWTTVSATVTTVSIAGSIAAGGPVGLAASLIYYTTNGLKALKGFVDTYHNLRNSFGDVATNLNRVHSSLEELKEQWTLQQQHANVVEASRAVLQAVFPESIVASTKTMLGTLDQISTACDRMELESRKMSPQLTEALRNLSEAQSVLEDLEDFAKGTKSQLLKSIVTDHKSTLSELTTSFEQTFDTMSEINGEVLGHRANIRNYRATLKAFRDKEMVWFRLFSIAWEFYVDFVGDSVGDLAPEPQTETWKEILEVCEQIDEVQGSVDKAKKIKESVEEVVETMNEEE